MNNSSRLRVINKGVNSSVGSCNIAGIIDFNSSFLEELEKLELNYIGGLAQNRLVSIINQKNRKKQGQKRLDEIVLSLPQKNFTEVT